MSSLNLKCMLTNSDFATVNIDLCILLFILTLKTTQWMIREIIFIIKSDSVIVIRCSHTVLLTLQNENSDLPSKTTKCWEWSCLLFYYKHRAAHANPVITP